jgi:hypothetical protein
MLGRVTLKLPLMSDDQSAVRVLLGAGEPVAVPATGLFDLLCLAFEYGVITRPIATAPLRGPRASYAGFWWGSDAV